MTEREKKLEELRRLIYRYADKSKYLSTPGLNEVAVWECRLITELSDEELDDAIDHMAYCFKNRDETALKLAHFQEARFEARVKRAGWLSILTGTW